MNKQQEAIKYLKLEDRGEVYAWKQTFPEKVKEANETGGIIGHYAKKYALSTLVCELRDSPEMWNDTEIEEDTQHELVENTKYMPDVEDLIKQQDTDAMKWALAFKKCIIENEFTMDDMKDESYMVGWFANAIETTLDSLQNVTNAKLDSKIDSLKEMIDVQKYNLTDSYMCGMANGMIFALTILDNKDPEYVEDVPDTNVELVEKLWQIIDDIDTIGDMAKDDDKLYRQLVEAKQKERWDLPIESDGHRLYINEPMPEDRQITESTVPDTCTVVEPTSPNGDYACKTTFQKVGDEVHVVNCEVSPQTEPEESLAQYKIECEWDMGFEYLYNSYGEALAAVEDVDWAEVGYDTWKEAEELGLVYIEEVK